MKTLEEMRSHQKLQINQRILAIIDNLYIISNLIVILQLVTYATGKHQQFIRVSHFTNQQAIALTLN